jgi:hypothetical protein
LIIAKAPGLNTSKTIKKVLKSYKSTKTDSSLNDSLTQFISKFIIINEFKRNKIEAGLKIANIPKTPEVFYAGAVVQFLKIIILAIPFFFFFQLVIPVLLILAVLKFIQETQSINKSIGKKREQIDLDLPRLVYAIIQELKNNHDVLTILERHKDSFSPEFSGEIAITIADMRTGNYEAALQRFEGRVGSSNLSKVVRGLIEMVKGNDTHVYWETLVIEFSEMQKQNLRKEANKVPARVRRLSFFLLMSITLTYVVVLGVVLMQSLTSFF